MASISCLKCQYLTSQEDFDHFDVEFVGLDNCDHSQEDISRKITICNASWVPLIPLYTHQITAMDPIAAFDGDHGVQAYLYGVRIA